MSVASALSLMIQFGSFTTERTIYRDIDALSAVGVPIVADAGAGGGFQLAEEFECSVEALTRSMSDTELELLFMNLSSRGLRDLAGELPLRTIFLKLLHTLPPDKQTKARWIQNSIHLDPTLGMRNPEVLNSSGWRSRRLPRSASLSLSTSPRRE